MLVGAKKWNSLERPSDPAGSARRHRKDTKRGTGTVEEEIPEEGTRESGGTEMVLDLSAVNNQNDKTVTTVNNGTSNPNGSSLMKSGRRSSSVVNSSRK